MRPLLFLALFIGFLALILVMVALLGIPPWSSTDTCVTCKSLAGKSLGAQLCQLSATFALGKVSRKRVVFPLWDRASMFTPTDLVTFDPNVHLIPTRDTQVSADNFDPAFFHKQKGSMNVNAIPSHPQYFECVRYDLRQLWSISDETVRKYSEATNAIVVYRDNSVSPTYYDAAIFYLQHHTPANTTVLIMDENTPDEKAFTSLFLSPWKVLSESALAWWAAWLDVRRDSQIFAPVAMHHALNTWHTYDNHGIRLSSAPHPLSLGAYYQCFRQPRAFENVCQNFRCIYPDASLVIVSDNGDDFHDLALSRFRATSYKTNPNRTGNGITTCVGSLDKMKLFVHNFILGARQISETWFILLEDDVYTDHALRIGSQIDENIVILGNNNNTAKLSESVVSLLGSGVPSLYYGGCGGSVFRTEFWANFDLADATRLLDLYATKHNVFHSDIVFTFLAYSCGKRVICAQDLYPSEFAEVKPLGGEVMPAILHQFKDWYV